MLALLLKQKQMRKKARIEDAFMRPVRLLSRRDCSWGRSSSYHVLSKA